MAKYEWRNLKTMKTTLSAMLRGKSFVVFDVETVGLDSKAYVTQFAGIKYHLVNKTFVEKEKFMTYIKVPVLIPDKVVAKVGITNAFLYDKLPEEIVIHDIYRFMKDVDCVIGHNIGFDMDKMQGVWERQNKGDFVFPYVVDTLEMARDLLPLKKFNLECIANYLGLGISSENFHNAMFDVEATSSAFQAFAGMYLDLANELLPEPEKEKVMLIRVDWWAGYGGNAQVNAHTDKGKIWFNQLTKKWLSNDVNLNFVDMEDLVAQVYQKTRTDSETISKWKGYGTKK